MRRGGKEGCTVLRAGSKGYTPGGNLLRADAPARVVSLVLLALALIAAPAHAQDPGAATPLGSDVQRLHFKYGPIPVAPGQNLILVGPVTIEKPAYDGWVVQMRPNLVRADGSVPNVDVIHLHHGVWLNGSRTDATSGGAERFYAAGEEKTALELPDGYGYPVKRDDVWLMNHMIHNQTPVADEVYITYDVDFVRADSARGKATKPVRPVWMDVHNGSGYPVFDVKRTSGGPDGKFVYPDDAADPYKGKPPLNEWTADRDGTLVSTAGHVHPGGLWTDLDLVRPSAGNGHRRANDHADLRRMHKRGHRAVKRKRSARARRAAHRRLHRRVNRAHRRFHTGAAATTRRLFRSEAVYYDPNGPVSWDMSMTGTDEDWRVGVKKGDKLRVSTTYETERASWYESMGINVVYMADDKSGPDPFEKRIDTDGEVTHGHLRENDNHGGRDQGAADPRALPDGATFDRRVGIAGFEYLPGNQGLAGPMGNPPVVRPGETLRFENLDWGEQIFHTITACKAPCNRSTGISYPLADGEVDFDSGELGYGPTGLTAAANRTSWETPPDLEAGTYTYFCRVHPYMRGSFRVKEN